MERKFSKRASGARFSFRRKELGDELVQNEKHRGAESDDDVEMELELAVREVLRECVVLGVGHNSFGLKWRFGSADDPEIVFGGWMFQATKDIVNKKKSKGKLSFYILDDKNECLRQCKDETATYTYHTLNYKDMVAVNARESPSGVVYCQIQPKRGSDWVIMPVQNTNDEIVVRWVAALRARADILDEDTINARDGALKVAQWTQSLVRMRWAIEKAERMRERRAGILNKMSGLVYGYADTDSEVSDDDQQDLDEFGNPAQPHDGNSFLVTFVSAVAADLYDNTFGQDDLNKRQQNKRVSRKLFRRSLYKPKTHGDREMKRNSSYIQDAFAFSPLEYGELEDELWENERWNVQGWGRNSLLPTDRAPFSDRIGRRNYQSLDDMVLPDGWEVTHDWELDISGQINGLCGTDGWMYGIDFPPVDSDLAKGKPKIVKGFRSVVRRRRWFRRRRPIKESRITSPVIWHGWLGRPSSGSGRWQSRYCVLTRGLRLHGRVTGVALSFFRTEYPDHLEMIATNNLEDWNNLSKKQLKTWNLDGAHIIQSDGKSGKKGGRKSKKQGNGPFLFELRVASEKEALKFVAGSSDDRENWLGSIQHAIKDQKERFTLTKSLELPTSGEFHQIPKYENGVLDRLLPLPVDETFDLLFFDKAFQANFYKENGFRDVKEDRWTRGKNVGSRKQVTYITPKRKIYGGYTVIHKMKLVRFDPGQGYQIDAAYQSPESPYGNIYQDEVRIVMMDWKQRFTRICITHKVNLRSEDEQVTTFVESNARRQILGHYVENWLPFVQRTLKRKREIQQQKSREMTLASPTGINYNLDLKSKSIKAEGFKY